MSSFLPPKIRWVDENGAPLAGAKIYFYATGTTNAKATYSNEALSNANANPVVADANGLTGRIFLLTDAEYRVRVEKSDGTLVWQEDNVDPAQLAQSGTQARLLQVACTPLDYSGVGDGTTDDATAVQAAIDAATGVVDLVGKTYRCDSAITLRAGITLRNGTLDFSQAASPPNEAIKIQGSRGDAVLLSADVAAGAVSIAPASLTGIAASDWLYIACSTAWSSFGALGEIIQVDSVSAPNVSLATPLQFPYTVAAAASVRELALVSNVTIEDLSITMNPSGSGTGTGILAQYTHNLVCRNVRLDGVKGIGIDVQASVGTQIEGCTVGRDGGSGKGISIGTYSRNARVDGCAVRRMDFGILAGTWGNSEGVTSDVVISRCHVEQAVTYGICVTASARGAQISDCDVVNCGAAVQINGADVSVRGGACRLVSGQYGVIIQGGALSYTTGAPYQSEVSGVSIIGGLGGIYVSSQGTCEVQASIIGNRIDGAGTYGISLSSATKLAGAVVSGNTVNVSGGGVLIDVSTTGYGATISGNSLYTSSTGATTYPLSITGGTKITVVGNTISRVGDHGPCVSTGTITGSAIVGNVIHNGTYGISTTADSPVIEGNRYYGQATGELTGVGVPLMGIIDLPLANFRELAAAVTQNAAANGGLLASDTTPTLQVVTATKELGVVWAIGNVDQLTQSVSLPPDFCYSVAPVAKLYVRSADTPVMTVRAYQGVNGSNLGGNTEATTASVGTVSKTLTALTSGSGRNFTVVIFPDAHAAATVDLFAAWIEYARI